ncbi:hypothetical protein [Actinoplanes friuliensis]|uniref:Cortactin-binding protein 2 n=1 Tax=Actinoplanes friuliensis DSM 7358 TaxID=1246995 RepID=U5VT48_9ACTN|nr:hypothetical protein [Actinoplanes friuliensis]AGZ39987.1 Cortactin-binding protein 2 [Actinoplanes friuliensis DSM 7358]
MTSTRTRPATVTVATALMAFTATGYLITAIALFGQVGHTRTWAGDKFRDFGGDTGTALVFAESTTVIVAVLTIVAALTLLASAASVRAGSQPGRIFAFTMMAILLLCGISAATRGGTPDFGNNVTMSTSRSNGTVTRTTVSALPESYGSAYRIGSGVFAGLAMLAMIAAIILLTRPSANRWFRPEPLPAGPPAGYRPYAAQPSPPPGHFGAPPPPAQFAGPPPAGTFAGPPPPGAYGGPPPPETFVPVAVPPQPPQWHAGPAPAADSEIAVLTRRHQRGELTDAEYAAGLNRLRGR